MNYSRINLSKDMILFLLNVIAGFGYLLGILNFYCKKSNGSCVSCAWRERLAFGLDGESADLYGNLAGDFSWTVEPFFVIVAVPIIYSYVSHRSYDVRYDAAIKSKVA